jgi:two-component system phosphate regulon response regulator PhoB
MTMPDTVLLVEDEADLLETMAYNFEREGFVVRTAATGAGGLEAARKEPLPAVILLDLMLPDRPGTEVCRMLRQDPVTREIPIVMVTAKGDEIDRIVGFELGADDYVAKPFSVRELLLRVRAVLRRARSGMAPSDSRRIEFGQLAVDLAGHRVWVAGEEVQLTALEFRLLETFLSRRGRVQTREMLLQEVWGSDITVTIRTVDTHVKRLRGKLGAAGDYVETLRGVGYRFRDRVDE